MIADDEYRGGNGPLRKGRNGDLIAELQERSTRGILSAFLIFYKSNICNDALALSTMVGMCKTLYSCM
jgi:hypothetical protein